MINEEKSEELRKTALPNPLHDGYGMWLRSSDVDEVLIKMAEWKDKQYKELIKMLVDELNTSKLYHLGITGLDTDAEIAQKRKDGDTALIRGIERTIKFVEESIK